MLVNRNNDTDDSSESVHNEHSLYSLFESEESISNRGELLKDYVFESRVEGWVVENSPWRSNKYHWCTFEVGALPVVLLGTLCAKA